MKKLIFTLSLLLSIHCYSQNIASQYPSSLPITSIDSDDFSDLKVFDSIFDSKRILFLGESHHGINDFNLLKYRLIRYLNQQHHFEVVAFESGIGDCGLTNLVKNQLTGMEMLIHSLHGVWRVKGNCEMMDYFRDHQMELAGFDPNITSLDLNVDQYNYLLKDKALSLRFTKADSLFLYQYKIPKINWKHREIPLDIVKLQEVTNQLKKEYTQLMKETKKTSLTNTEKIIFSKSISSRLLALTTNTDKKRDDYFIVDKARDKLMADNLSFIADTLYKNKKIIVWAHNAHIGKTGTPMINANVSIGDYLPQSIKDQSFIIGFYAISGEYAAGMSPPEKIKIRSTSSEKAYTTFSSKAIYVPNTAMVNKKYYHGIPDFSKTDISKLYDGVIFVKKVTASKLILFNKELKCE